jgi:dihydrolipoamide dehydrogenase
MTQFIEIKVPDIGDFKEVDVIEILVKPGDRVEKEGSLVSLESDKATMEIPSSHGGVVRELRIKIGDKVSEGSVLILLEAEEAQTAPAATAQSAAAAATAAVAAGNAAMPVATPVTPATSAAGPVDLQADVVVLGAGPGGYTAAFRAADLSKKVVLVERYSALGGVCLNVGCIPSKALLHAAKVITEAEEMAAHGVSFGKPAVDIAKLRGWKESVIGRLTKGLAGLAKQRKVQVVQGHGVLESPRTITVTGSDGKTTRVGFDTCIIAAGSSVARIPGFPYDDPRLIDSTGALALADVPQRLLVIGGGIIGLEMACVYDALGSKVTVVELMNQLIPGADADLVRPLAKRIEKRYEKIYLGTKVVRIESKPDGLYAQFEGEGAPTEPQRYDRVLLAVGRRPNGRGLGAENAGVAVNERGYIPVDAQQRTNVTHIYAIGDVCGEPMLAHKATHEAKVAAEVIAGHKAAFDALTIPSVAYTDPEVAWMGLTETDAKKRGIAYEKASFPWAASGRALSIGREEGATKLLFDPASKRILGAGIVGTNAGELIAEMVLALEMGADMEDIGLTIHPHPTLSETTNFAAEMALGTITDLYIPKKK